MKNLLTIRRQDFEPNAPITDTSSSLKREAARAVLLDKDGGIYLLMVGNHNYHKLPGGGIDDGEDVQTALARELVEEVGCRAEVTADLGTILEYRTYDDGTGLEQTSYCYLAKQIGEQGEAALEEGEIDDGMYEVKAANIDEAIKLLENDQPNNLEGQFIQKRDLAFLKAAKEAMK